MGSRTYRLARNAYQRVLNRGFWRERKAARDFFRQFVSPGDLAFDVGANRGFVAECLYELGARVVAVEPNIALAEWLQRRYPFDIVPKAVGAAEGEAQLFVGRFDGCSTLSEAWRFQQAPLDDRWTDEAVSVPVTTLDRLIERYGTPAFVKIDVEGYEDQVLAGLTRAVPALAFEFQLSAPDVARRCVERLTSLGAYRFAISIGETRSLAADWGVPVLDALDSFEDRTLYGDVYARLVT